MANGSGNSVGTGAPSSGGAPVSAPSSSTPAPAAPGAGSAQPQGGADTSAPQQGSQQQEYDFMGEFFGSADGAPTKEVEPIAPPPAPPKEQPPPQGDQPAPTQPPAEQQPAQTTEQQGLSPPQAPRQAEGQEREQFDPTDPSALAQGLGQFHQQAIEYLAQTAFKLSPEELRTLEEDVAGTVPKLLAKAVVFSQQQFLQQLGTLIPQMLQKQQVQQQKHATNLNKFYAAWPTLDRNKHGELVQELGVRYRKMFPDHTLDQMVQNLGPLVLSAAGLPLQSTVGKAPATQNANGQQPSGKQQPRGFVPASPGTVTQMQQVSDDPFGYMGASGD